MAISALGAREPKAYSEIGYILYELGIIGKRDAETLRSMAGLRNILVHSYARVDRRKIFEFSKKLRDDALRIANTILKSVREKNVDPKEEGLGEIISKLSRVLKGRVEVMMVYREGELTPGYNFYFKNEHYDVSYPRPRILREPRDVAEQRVKIAEIEELYSRENEVLRVFKSAFYKFGGYPERNIGYWRRALSSIIYQELPQTFKFFYIEDKGSLVGYAIIGRNHGEPLVSIFEWATLNGRKDLAAQLIASISGFAARNKCNVRIYSPDFSLYDDVLKKMGFVGLPRWKSSKMIMVHIVDPESLAKKVWRENESLKDAKVSAWSTRKQVVLHHPETHVPRKEITLEMKDDILTRLLLSRVDLVNAVKQELVTVVKGDMKDIREVAYSLPYTPWEYHEIDYI